jgi:hypothetical protein
MRYFFIGLLIGFFLNVIIQIILILYQRKKTGEKTMNYDEYDPDIVDVVKQMDREENHDK